mmetsp:Transcript_70262/g.117880  ORF Transcript_70262/g.117880 Transcript_70262/m.117880 type:complete len:372 (-) Transcript_70262:260-1375(-)
MISRPNPLQLIRRHLPQRLPLLRLLRLLLRLLRLLCGLGLLRAPPLLGLLCTLVERHVVREVPVPLLLLLALGDGLQLELALLEQAAPPLGDGQLLVAGPAHPLLCRLLLALREEVHAQRVLRPQEPLFRGPQQQIGALLPVLLDVRGPHEPPDQPEAQRVLAPGQPVVHGLHQVPHALLLVRLELELRPVHVHQPGVAHALQVPALRRALKPLQRNVRVGGQVAQALEVEVAQVVLAGRVPLLGPRPVPLHGLRDVVPVHRHQPQPPERDVALLVLGLREPGLRLLEAPRDALLPGAVRLAHQHLRWGMAGQRALAHPLKRLRATIVHRQDADLVLCLGVPPLRGLLVPPLGLLHHQVGLRGVHVGHALH